MDRDNIRLIWHCSKRGTTECKTHVGGCKGTDCRHYLPYRGSWHSYKTNDPIKGFLTDDGKPIEKGGKF